MDTKPEQQTEPRIRRPDAAAMAMAGIVLLALALRLWGIGWALPNAGRYFSYHPDESTVLRCSQAVNPFLLQLDPHYYNYPSLTFLLNGAAIVIGRGYHWIGAGPERAIPPASALLAARLITVVLGAATSLFLFGAGRLFYRRAAGLVAAGLYAVAPLAVQHGHWGTVDVPANFWIAGALFFAARALSPEVRPRDLLWCGLWSGLAAATKYNAGLVACAGLAAALLLPSTRPKLRGCATVLIGAFTAFLCGCPAILLHPREVFTAIAYESRHTRTGHGDVFTGTVSGFVYHIVVSLRWGLMPPLLIAVLLGVGWAVCRRRRSDLVLLAFVVPYYLLIGLAEVKFARYTLPLFPPLFLFAGALYADAALSRRPIVRAVAHMGLAVAAACALCFSIALDSAMTQSDTRDRAADFVRQQGFPTVGFATGPWFYSPSLQPYLACDIPFVAQQSAADSIDPHLFPSMEGPTPMEWDTNLIAAQNPDCIAISEYEYADALRLQSPDAQRFLAYVAGHYPHRQVFGKPIKVFGWAFTNVEESGFPVQGLPHDMLYTNPTTIVFYK